MKNRFLFNITVSIKYIDNQENFFGTLNNFKSSTHVTSFNASLLPNKFALFSKKGEYFLASPLYNSFDIIILNIDNKFTIVLKGHKANVYCIRYKNLFNLDYLISSSKDKSIKVWDISSNTCMLSLDNCHNSINLYSCLLVSINSMGYIISSVCCPEKMKIFEFPSGVLLKQYGHIKDYTIFIDVWIDNQSTKTYILNSNIYDIKLIDFDNGKEFLTFKSKDNKAKCYWEVITVDKKLIATNSKESVLTIWNIYTSEILKVINLINCGPTILLWNHQTVITSTNKNLLIINISTFKIKEVNHNHKSKIGTFKKFYHNKYGEILLTGGGEDCNKIYNWSTKIKEK